MKDYIILLSKETFNSKIFISKNSSDFLRYVNFEIRSDKKTSDEWHAIRILKSSLHNTSHPTNIHQKL